jgi:hypothetical protein
VRACWAGATVLSGLSNAEWCIVRPVHRGLLVCLLVCLFVWHRGSRISDGVRVYRYLGRQGCALLGRPPTPLTERDRGAPGAAGLCVVAELL